jgi:DNA-binding CsgD family transcriptional regulator
VSGKTDGARESRTSLARSGTGSLLPPNPKTLTTDASRELVARDDELGQLAEFRRKAAAGHGSIVLISGEAGVGKSTLLRKFESDLGGGRAVYASARCVEFIQTPLGPLRELLDSIDRNGNIPRDAGARALFERLTFERDAATTSAPPAGWLLESIDAAFARYAQRGTVILAIEDIHWADRSTLTFLTYLADRIATRRMLVVATYRGDEVSGSHPRLADFAALLPKKTVAQLTLEPLDERATHTLIELALPYPDAVNAATIADIARRSQGNPFFAEELLQAAMARSVPGAKRQLPLSIRGAVLARAALLTDGERTILSLASVLGERFSVNRLVTLCDGRRDEVVQALDRAHALQLVTSERTAPGEVTFQHALTQEVLYGELLAESVRPLHEAIGLELENRHDHNAVSVELAHHWYRAGDRERAAHYAELAGDQAFAIGALADAIAYYERALAERKSEDATVAGLHHKIGLALGSLGRLSTATRRLRRAGEIYWGASDFEGFAHNASALGAQLYNTGDAAAAIDVYRETIAALEGKLPGPTLDLLRARMGYDCVAALDFTSALALVSEIHEPIADPATATHANQARFKVAAMRGELAEWRTYAERALEAARLVPDDGYRLYQTQCQVALDALGLGELAQAREHFAATVSIERGRNFSARSLAYAASSLEHTLRGEFNNAAMLLAKPANAHEESYPILIHIRSAQLALGICAGDDALLRSDGTESMLRYAGDHGMKLALGLLGGPYAWALGLRGEAVEAARLIHRIGKVLPGPHRFLFAFLAAAQFGNRSDVLAMRRQLQEAAGRPQDRVNKAVLGLFDGFAARRGIVSADGPSAALEAAASFASIGWPWLAALGYELGGESKRALEAYRNLGALRDLRRMEVDRTADTAVLSRREREVAELVAKGHTNDEVAQMLHISPRTVEKHVSAALEKLNLRSRVQLGILLN